MRSNGCLAASARLPMPIDSCSRAQLPDAFTPAFAEDEHKQRQWNAFFENVALHPGSLADVIAGGAGFVMPHAIAAATIGRSG